MNKLLALLSLPFLIIFIQAHPGNIPNKITTKDTLPAMLPAAFTDDYQIRYTINDTLWTQLPNTRYQILKWNKEERYIILQNHAQNKWDQGLYSRIDYIPLPNMLPYTWAYCLSIYNAKSDSLAEFGPRKTDTTNPRKGCNGYPFSRMKPTQ